jgi:hypothetical protein
MGFLRQLSHRNGSGAGRPAQAEGLPTPQAKACATGVIALE